MTGLAHAAVLTVTGWPTRHGEHLVVGGLYLETPATPPSDVRVMARGWPRSTVSGVLKATLVPAGNVRPASGPNGTHVLVVGHLLKLDGAEGLIRVEVCPAKATTRPCVVTLHATTQILQAIDPSETGVRVTGRVLAGRVPLLLAETCEVVHAPVPARWQTWRGRWRSSTSPAQAAD